LNWLNVVFFQPQQLVNMCAEDYAIAYSKWQNCFCEAGVRTVFNESHFFSNDPLWDLFGRTISVRQV